MIGWVYWMSWVSTVGLEFTAAGMLMTRWFPDVPIWAWSGIFVVVLFSLNALATRAFGEAEYWFAGVKVAAILAFIVIGVLVNFWRLAAQERRASSDDDKPHRRPAFFPMGCLLCLR